jgi:alpha-1,6-mannosyltransferase
VASASIGELTEASADLVAPPGVFRAGWRWMIGAGLASLLIYGLYLGFVAFLPFHLTQQRIYLFSAFKGGNAEPFIFTFAVGALFAFAAVAWRVTATLAGSRLRFLALLPPVISALLLFLTLPLTSRDIFYYIMEGRVLGIHLANPYLQPPSAFPNDPLFQYTNWPDYTSPYGPLWLLLSAGLTLLAGNSVLWNVCLFKVVAVVGYFACAGLIGAILRARGRPVLPGVVLWLWNPLVLLEYPGAGHNDVLMLAGLLLGLWLYLSGRARLALAAIAVAAMVKSVALVILPLLLWHQLAPLPNWRARAWAAARLSWLPALIIGVTLGPFWAGAATFGPLRESSHYYSSAGHVVRIVLEWFVSPRLAGDLVRATIVLTLFAGYLAIMRRVPGDAERLLAGAVWAMFLLLVLWPFFVPWYCVWAVALVATLGSRQRGWQTLILCAGAMVSYLLQLYLPLRMAVSVEVRSTLSALLIFGPFALSFVPWAAIQARVLERVRRGSLVSAAAQQPEMP